MEQDPEHAWDELAPNNEESQMHSRHEGTEDLTNIYTQDLSDNANLLGETGDGSIQARFECAANMDEIPPKEYKEMMRQLNSWQ